MVLEIRMIWPQPSRWMRQEMFMSLDRAGTASAPNMLALTLPPSSTRKNSPLFGAQGGDQRLVDAPSLSGGSIRLKLARLLQAMEDFVHLGLRRFRRGCQYKTREMGSAEEATERHQWRDKACGAFGARSKHPGETSTESTCAPHALQASWHHLSNRQPRSSVAVVCASVARVSAWQENLFRFGARPVLPPGGWAPSTRFRAGGLALGRGATR